MYKNKYDEHEPTTTLNYKLLTLDQKIEYLAGFNMFVRNQPPLT